MELVFKALQDETRRRILDLLKERSLNAGEISEHFSMSKPSISYHLDLLRQAGLVSARKEGQFVQYTLESTVLDESLGWMMDLLNYGKKHTSKNSLAGGGAGAAALRRRGGSVA
jgi:DNA-binding transcriptional ArsR family regulator